MDNEKYVLHNRNLRQYLDLGLKLKKVHRVLQFNFVLNSLLCQEIVRKHQVCVLNYYEEKKLAPPDDQSGSEILLCEGVVIKEERFSC